MKSQWASRNVLAGIALGLYGDTSLILKIVPMQTQFSAELSGSSAGTDSPATGQTLLKLNLASGLISYQLNVQDIENVTMAHIHIADLPGSEGPPAVWLYNYGKTGVGFYPPMCYDINIRVDFEKHYRNRMHILGFEVGTYEKDTVFPLISRSFSNCYPNCFCCR